MTGQRRLADDRVPRPRRPPVLRRHLLPEPTTARACPASCACWTRSTTRGATRRDDLARAGRAAARRDRASSTAIGGARRRGDAVRRRPRRRGRATCSAQFDPRFGGFGRAPKFPQAMTLTFLLAHARRATRRRRRSRSVTVSLDAMAAGGMYDQVGGGFHRYSVDAYWLVPHFEKMLYDQALLARAYLHGWLVTGRAALPARRRGDDRATCCATCATPTAGSSPPRTPTPRASRASSTSGRSRSSRRSAATTPPEVVRYFGVTARRQLRRSAHRLPRQHPPRRRPRPRTAPTRSPRVLPAAARRARAARAPRARRQGAARVERAVPALARRGRRRARARRLDGRGAHERALPARASCAATTAGSCARGRTGGPHLLAYAEDYAALLEALLTLAEVDDVAWLAEARTRRRRARSRCSPTTSAAAFFTTGTDAEALIVRPKDFQDNATPSENSLAANGLLRLAALTGDAALRGAAPRGGSATLAPVLGEHPTAFAFLLEALERARHPADRGRDRRRRRRPGTRRAASTSSARRLLPASVQVARRTRRRRRPHAAARRPRPRRRRGRPRTCASTSPAGSRSPTPTTLRAQLDAALRRRDRRVSGPCESVTVSCGGVARPSASASAIAQP